MVPQSRVQLNKKRQLNNQHPQSFIQFYLLFAVCRKDQFHCPYDGCIDAQHVCDGKNHCSDGSDEAYCVGKGKSAFFLNMHFIKSCYYSTPTFIPMEIILPSGHIILPSGCIILPLAPLTTGLRCSTGRIMRPSDRTMCPSGRMSHYTFSMIIIIIHFQLSHISACGGSVCDGIKDCLDGSDEEKCNNDKSNQIEQNESCSPMEGWKLLSNWHLHPSMGTMSYSEALDECKNLGANLVDKDSFQEVSFLCL